MVARVSAVIGPVYRLWQTVQQLKWRWVSPCELHTDLGDVINLITMPWTWIMRMARVSQLSMLLRRINRSGHDLGHLHSVDYKYGLDETANAKVLRARTGKHALHDRWLRSLLITFVVGGYHTQQGMRRSKLAVDPSPLCVYCDEEEEIQEHIPLRCPRWASCRDCILLADTRRSKSIPGRPAPGIVLWLSKMRD